ncbi:hypothetical protein DICVIV_00408 [Dictyocaulus viviparus]|uniref:Uncharacterized protein n=1 Tax=Dictyocaulus viviparus TaxID=29172 RepID=A0A0D8Y9P5_DICVI|nr:hypothetical protein DICVIV_00408 [Dictyocaulus viviparus]
MASNTTKVLNNGMDSKRNCGKCTTYSRSGNELPPNLHHRFDLNFTTLRNEVGEIVMKIDPVLEQIERNRRIAERLSPVLKYKEMLRKCRSRAAPRRKFSIVQGYPRMSRWKIPSQSRGQNSVTQSCYNNKTKNG